MSDLHPTGIKIGMLGTRELVLVVGEALKQIKQLNKDVFIVLDPGKSNQCGVCNECCQ